MTATQIDRNADITIIVVADIPRGTEIRVLMKIATDLSVPDMTETMKIHQKAGIDIDISIVARRRSLKVTRPKLCPKTLR